MLRLAVSFPVFKNCLPQLIQLSIVLMVLSDWLEDQLNMKEELKYVSMEYGVQSVMTTGVVLMLLLYANNLDMVIVDVRQNTSHEMIQVFLFHR